MWATGRMCYISHAAEPTLYFRATSSPDCSSLFSGIATWAQVQHLRTCHVVMNVLCYRLNIQARYFIVLLMSFGQIFHALIRGGFRNNALLICIPIFMHKYSWKVLRLVQANSFAFSHCFITRFLFSFSLSLPVFMLSSFNISIILFFQLARLFRWFSFTLRTPSFFCPSSGFGTGYWSDFGSSWRMGSSPLSTSYKPFLFVLEFEGTEFGNNTPCSICVARLIRLLFVYITHW